MKHKCDDYKLNAVDYYLTEDKSQEIMRVVIETKE
jgi:hypothetical protein